MKISFSDYGVGAGLATDLVNTSPRVWRSAGEMLPGPAALTEFLAEHDIRPDALADGRPATEEELTQVRTLRQETRELLTAETEEGVAEGARALVLRAGRGPALHRDVEDRWQWYVETAPGASLADELAVLIGTGLLGALRTLSHDRFRHCASPGCEGVFVDTSRAGRRRYCMPELCGNRLNVAAHRARKQGTSPADGDRPG